MTLIKDNQETEVNKLWFTMIVAEMALCYNTGLINRAGSPFAQFRELFPDLPKNKKKALLWVDELCKFNEFVPVPSFTKTIKLLN
jgi:hypothetical protein